MKNNILSLGIIFLGCLLLGCNRVKTSTNQHDDLTIDLDQNQIESQHLNINITIKGKALNAKQGAVIVGSKSWVFIDNLDQWSETMYGNQVAIQGQVYKKTFPEKNDDDGLTSGPSGTFNYLILSDGQNLDE